MKIIEKLKNLFKTKYEIVEIEGVFYVKKGSEWLVSREESFSFWWFSCVEKHASGYATAGLAEDRLKTLIDYQLKPKPKKKIVKTIYLSLICAVLISCSGLSANIGGFSRHFDGKKYNEIHNNVGLHYEMNLNKAIKIGLVGETYHNSYSRRTVFLGATASRQVTKKVDVGLSAGYITGYDHNVAVFPFARYNFTRNVGTRIICLPALVKYPAFCAISASLRFN